MKKKKKETSLLGMWLGQLALILLLFSPLCTELKIGFKLFRLKHKRAQTQPIHLIKEGCRSRIAVVPNTSGLTLCELRT